MTTVYWVAFGSTMVPLGVVWWLRNQLLIVTVEGQSMAPTLQDGDRLLVRRQRPDRLRRGQIVVVDRPPEVVSGAEGFESQPAVLETRVVKRIAAVGGEPLPAGADKAGSLVPKGQVFLIGDNLHASTDSRHYGCVSTTKIVGLVGRRLA